MGWREYDRVTRLMVFNNLPVLEDDELIEYFFIKSKVIFLIEKQKLKKSYKFIKVAYKASNSHFFQVQKQTLTSVKFSDNLGLLKLIIKEEAFLEEYVRNFKINRILK